MNTKDRGNSLVRQWLDCGEWTTSTCPTCGTNGADVKAVLDLLAEARTEIAAWYDEHCGMPADDLEVVKKIDALLTSAGIAYG